MSDPQTVEDHGGRPRAVAQVRPKASIRVRLAGMALLAVSGTLLGVAAWLKPDPRGYGTHEQLGASRCGMLVLTGLPCPSCGMTTAFAETMEGHPLRAFWAQPTGFIFALATIGLAAAAAWMLATGRLPPLDYLAVTPFRLFATLLILLLGGWGLKILFGFIDGTLPMRR